MRSMYVKDGPMFKIQFVIWDWISFVDKDGKHCLERNSIQDLIDILVNSGRTLQNDMGYANHLQGGSWD